MELLLSGKNTANGGPTRSRAEGDDFHAAPTLERRAEAARFPVEGKLSAA
jgi:hypothetical protein